MIKHHPTDAFLMQHSRGELAFSLSIAVSAHIEMCPICGAKQEKLEALQAEEIWALAPNMTSDLDEILQRILATDVEKSPTTEATAPCVSLGEGNITLPKVFTSFKHLKWSGFGAFTRARVINNEDKVHANLLHIKKASELPFHQHQGYEITLLLAGSFNDEHDSYHKGDFVLLSDKSKHTPKTEQGCLCYTVQNAPVHFDGGMSKILNPLGKFIY